MQLIRHLPTQHRAPLDTGQRTGENRVSGDSSDGPSALAIGNFDGLHRGHQALIDTVCSIAGEQGLVPALMCFEPLPAALLRPDQPPARLMTVRDRIMACRQAGIARLLMPRFDRAFASLSPEAFVQRWIVDAAQARHVVVGEDFRFGARATGDVARLRELGQQHGFALHAMAAVTDEQGERIASTRIRAHLAAGELDQAACLLGRPYTLSGRVRVGQQLGRTLGYPTVNLRPPEPPAVRGIFAVRVSGASFERHPAVASLGLRPTVGGDHWLLEVHLFDCDKSLYGVHLTVEFVARLRDELHFADLQAMVEQMHLDAAQARAILTR
jgi:riboflavin kinase/FMN adenylyltransferase